MSGTPGRRWAASAAAVCALVLAACGIAPEPSAVTLPGGAASISGLAHSPPTTRPPKPASDTSRARTCPAVCVVYDIDAHGKLQNLSAKVAQPVTLLAVLDALVAGPIGHFLTAIPSDTEVLSASIDSAGLATIDLSSTFWPGSQSALTEAVAQVVLTTYHFGTTETPPQPVDGVSFELEDQPVYVPVGPPTNALVIRPVTTQDYKAMEQS